MGGPSGDDVRPALLELGPAAATAAAAAAAWAATFAAATTGRPGYPEKKGFRSAWI